MIAELCATTIVAVLVGRVVRPVARRPRRPDESPPRVRPGMISPRHRTTVLVALAVLAVVVLGPLLVGAVVPAVIGFPRLRHILAARRQRRRITTALPDAIEMLILVVHAGMTPHQAILLLEERAPRPIRPAFAEVRRRTSRGAPLADALAALPELLGPGALLVADALAMAERYGTPIGPALRQLSVDVRERRRRTTEAEARQLPIRMSFPLVVCTLPSFVLLAIVPAVLAALESLDATGF